MKILKQDLFKVKDEMKVEICMLEGEVKGDLIVMMLDGEARTLPVVFNGGDYENAYKYYGGLYKIYNGLEKQYWKKRNKANHNKTKIQANINDIWRNVHSVDIGKDRTFTIILSNGYKKEFKIDEHEFRVLQEGDFKDYEFN